MSSSGPRSTSSLSDAETRSKKHEEQVRKLQELEASMDEQLSGFFSKLGARMEQLRKEKGASATTDGKSLGANAKVSGGAVAASGSSDKDSSPKRLARKG